jgi:uncharacterized protein (TIGR00369 family)
MNENNPQTAQRTRLVTWEDPLPGAKAAPTMSGLDYLQAVTTGKLSAPPRAHLLNFEFVEVEKGRIVFAVEPAEYHYNPLGAVHGGLAATLCDSALACAVHSTLPAGVGYTTIELHINYTRPITTNTGRLRCIGQIIHVGRRMGTDEARLVDAQDKLYAHATTTGLIFQPE